VSEERGKRDETSEDVSASDSSTSDDTASATDEAVASASGTAGSDAQARPTGKRTARRTRAASVEKTPAAASSVTKVATRSDKPREPKRMNIFKRLRKFLREVVAELRKVIWPNRKQMVTYTSVVLVFVAFMVAFISGLDLAFTQGVEWLFG
jgi:preprotein translocase subunit SecE